MLVSWYFSHTLNSFFVEYSAVVLQHKARLIEKKTSEFLISKNYVEARNFFRETGKKVCMRITLILANGKVVADSDSDPEMMDNHVSRPEIREALEGKTGTSVRFSSTLKKDILYSAIPLSFDGQIKGVLRTAEPLITIHEIEKEVNSRILFAGLLICFWGLLALLYFSKKASRPLEFIKQGALRLASGDLEYRIPFPDSEEMAKVAESLNEMAAQLQSRIQTIQEKQNEQKTVMESMREILVVFNKDEVIINCNRAAEQFFHFRVSEICGKSVQEIIRNSELQRFIKKAFGSTEPLEGEIVFRDEKEERCLQAHANHLNNDKGGRIGLLLVLNDITRLKKLEIVRKDFVSNVSHELKTPVTSIKGYVETLISGAKDNPEERDRFLQIVMKQTERLQTIIEDLLSLSRIEQESEKEEIVTETGNLVKVVEAALQSAKNKADERRIVLEFTEKQDLFLEINASLLEQAIANLIDNAVKYSEPGSRVLVEIRKTEKAASIAVRDFGSGIPEEHLPRLFERFYRVDKARSRKLGGTGLGLSIVKHIVQAHKGTVSVESKPGKGSVFTIFLPL